MAAPASGETPATPSTETVEQGNFHAYERLVSGVEWPAGVDPRNRDRHLSASDFERIFGMTRGAFDALPGWRRQRLKKQHKLF